MTLGEKISSLRGAANMSQGDLAEKLNYTDKAISKWERGESAPDVITLVQLADQFDITVHLKGSRRRDAYNGISGSVNFAGNQCFCN